MKKTLFLLLLLPLLGRGLGGGLLFAQNTIDVSGLKVEAGTVTFNVEWSDAGASNLWSDTVWVFVDYNKNGKMTRMLISGGTLTAHSGTGEFKEENPMGAWVVGDARTKGSFSATVQLLTATADLYGACAYASSYPPVGQYVSASEIVFSGTPWYEIKLLHSDGYTIETIESGSTFLLPCSYTVSSFTDKTGAPGIIKCLAPTALTLATPYTTICAGQTVTLAASATGAASYSLDGSTWQAEDAFEVSPSSTTHYTLYAQTEDGCVTSVANAAVVTVNPLPTNLTLSPSPATICNGAAATLTATANGAASYSLNGSSWQTTTTFKVTPGDNASYTLYVKTAAGCTATKTNAAAVAVYPAFSPGTITTASATTNKDVDPNVTIASPTDASGGDDNITYQWRRTGTSSATLAGPDATYTIGMDAANYSTVGTYYFNRYAHDGACSTTWVAAAGTYTLGVTPSTITLCEECCWSGSTWVDCSITTYAYPFDSDVTNTTVIWSAATPIPSTTYFPGATSDRNGRANTAAIASTTNTVNAVQLCKDLGPGWYLPAYEELVNMSAGDLNSPLNGRSGADLLYVLSGIYWSSTEWYNNGGRHNNDSNITMSRTFAVRIRSDGGMYAAAKNDNMLVQCARQP